jgi:hypothetical protein
MMPAILTRVRRDATRSVMRPASAILVALLGSLSAGCVQVSAPEKPIEINLNINIRQEVVVRLQQDVKNLIENNPGVF